MDRTRRGMMALTATAALGRPEAAAQGRATPFPLVELRQYRNRPGKRDILIDLFEREFVESQEAVGMKVIGTFRQPAQPDHFVWLRGFADIDTRAKALNAFYFGPVWQAHREAANATIDDNDDVLLLREARPGSGFVGDDSPRPAPGAASPRGLVVAVIDYPKDETAYAEAFQRRVRPQLAAAGASAIAEFVREKSPNNFPRLPVRESEAVFVWFVKFRDRASYDRARAALDAIGRGQATLLVKPSDVLELEPTARSQLHG